MDVIILQSEQVLNNSLITIGVQHSPEHECDSWEENQFNYRLNYVDDIWYAVLNNEVIAHIALKDDVIQALFVDEKHRGNGISYKLYEKIIENYTNFFSDNAREKSAEKIWKRLLTRFPSQIKYDPKKDQYEYNSSGF